MAMRERARAGAFAAACALAAMMSAQAIAAPSASPGKLKVYISADMEGVGGVSTWEIQAGRTGPDYEKFRRLMTLETNAAIAGAFDAGATEVLVSDSHGDAQNLDLELLDKRVKVVRAWPRPLLMMQGIDDSFDAAVFVGYHASEWRAAAILAHTMTGGLEIRLNGRVVPEAGLNAAVAGEFGVPVVFISGDQTIGEEARKLLGPIEAVAVKQATGYYSATMIHPEEAQRLIREGVKRALGRRSELKPYRPERPVKMELVCKETVDAEILSDLPGVERTAGNVVVFTARDALQASRFLNVVFSLNTFSD